MAVNILKKFENNRTFSEDESWMLFKIAAYSEAAGWTMLITGVALQKYLVGNNIPILIAGRIHGILFLIYALASLGLYPSLAWSKKQTLLALMSSVPPYGSIIFVELAWHLHQKNRFEITRSCLTLALINNL